MSLPESVERIVVRVMAEQRAFDRSRQLIGVPTSTEPDSGEVTREIFEAFARAMETDEIEMETYSDGTMYPGYAVAKWLRSQAQERDDE